MRLFDFSMQHSLTPTRFPNETPDCPIGVNRKLYLLAVHRRLCDTEEVIHTLVPSVSHSQSH